MGSEIREKDHEWVRNLAINAGGRQDPVPRFRHRAYPDGRVQGGVPFKEMKSASFRLMSRTSIRMKKGAPDGWNSFRRMPLASLRYRAYLVPPVLTPFGIGLSRIIR